MMQAGSDFAPPPDFDRLAKVYRWLEYLGYGAMLQQVRTHWIDDIAGCRTALVFGDGDGRFLATLMARNPALDAIAVDTSAAMLQQLRARCLREVSDAGDRLQTVHGSALTLSPSPRVDLVVSHFFLDCLRDEELRQLARGLANALAPGTRWLVSDFDVPRRPWLRFFTRVYIRLLYAAFRWLTGLRVSHLPNISGILEEAGFRRVRRHERAAGLLYTEVWRLGTETSSPRVGSTAALPLPSSRRPTPSMNERAAVHNDLNPPSREIAETEHSAAQNAPADAQPDPEPEVPSLSEPDPGVFQHAPAPASEATASPLQEQERA